MTAEVRLKIINLAKKHLTEKKRTNLLDILSDDLKMPTNDTAELESIIYELLQEDGVTRTNWELIIDPKHKS